MKEARRNRATQLFKWNTKNIPLNCPDLSREIPESQKPSWPLIFLSSALTQINWFMPECQTKLHLFFGFMLSWELAGSCECSGRKKQVSHFDKRGVGKKNKNPSFKKHTLQVGKKSMTWGVSPSASCQDPFSEYFVFVLFQTMRNTSSKAKAVAATTTTHIPVNQETCGEIT